MLSIILLVLVIFSTLHTSESLIQYFAFWTCYLTINLLDFTTITTESHQSEQDWALAFAVSHLVIFIPHFWRVSRLLSIWMKRKPVKLLENRNKLEPNVFVSFILSVENANLLFLDAFPGQPIQIVERTCITGYPPVFNYVTNFVIGRHSLFRQNSDPSVTCRFVSRHLITDALWAIFCHLSLPFRLLLFC